MDDEKIKLWLSIFVDTAFLLLWCLVTWLLNQAVDFFTLESKIDKIVLNVFIWGLGISTIVSTIVFLIKDTIKVIIQAWIEIREEFNRLNNNETE
ncbi:conserved hypothetical protein [Hyella patelloides LEGE 07179]|uniref:DUF4282 domain-containing protein n=1 Tax=Hyella patelloides LEGE 07179 TaxID=945734 RepID=A0A563VJX2_9CYAN|nr:hypothetical protein [Hyella patelloides]VEP11760.1 conserved hypothetical protein [Hyella patelloides LEGE 07179]